MKIMSNDFDFDFNFDFSADNEKKKKEEDIIVCDVCKNHFKKSESFVRKSKNIYRKAFSELNLMDIMPVEFEEDQVIHIISQGDIDSLSYLKYLLRFQNLEYLLFSTWCMAEDDILLIDEWICNDKIKNIDAYVGEIFTGTYSKEYALLKKVINKTDGRICVFRNHSKIFAGKGEKFSFIVESSANINTNPRAENTTITISEEAFNFYKKHFDDIKSFTNDYTEWRPYEN